MLNANDGSRSRFPRHWALHVTLAARGIDPAETEAFSTPFMGAGFSYSAPFEDLRLK